MKVFFKVLVLVFISGFAFGQNFFEGEIYIKLKKQYGNRIANLTKAADLKQQLPFIESRLSTNGKTIERIWRQTAL